MNCCWGPPKGPITELVVYIKKLSNLRCSNRSQYLLVVVGPAAVRLTYGRVVMCGGDFADAAVANFANND